MATYPVIFTIGLSVVTIILYLTGKLYVAPIQDEYRPKVNPDLKAVKPQAKLKTKQANKDNIELTETVSEKRKHLKVV